MAEVPTFDLWLEFEHTEPPPGDDPTDDFANVQVRLPDGRKYALNVWTFKFLHRARFRWPYADASGRPAEYVVAPPSPSWPCRIRITSPASSWPWTAATWRRGCQVELAAGLRRTCANLCLPLGRFLSAGDPAGLSFERRKE
jgi:hypothetical protein